MNTQHALNRAKATIGALTDLIWNNLGIGTSEETENTISMIDQVLGLQNPPKGGRVIWDQRTVNSVKLSLEGCRMELGNNPKFEALAVLLDHCIEEAVKVSYSINERLTIDQ